MINQGERWNILKGERIAQLIVTPIIFPNIIERKLYPLPSVVRAVWLYRKDRYNLMSKKTNYDNQAIVSLKGADRVRKRPGVIFGSDGLVDVNTPF